MGGLLKGAAVLTGVLALPLSAASAGRLIPVPQVPGSYYTEVSSINDNAEIVGDANFNSNGVIYRDAFVGTLDGQYTTFFEGDDSEFPTYAIGINNDGYVSGNAYYDDDLVQCGHGFVRAPHGKLTDVTRDGAIFSGRANGITQRKNFVGWSCEISGSKVLHHGYYGRGTTYRADLVLPFNTDRTDPGGLSRKGVVVGGFLDNDLHKTRAFFLEGGVATAFDYPDPNAAYTVFGAINDKGIASGTWSDANLEVFHAFLFDTKRLRLKAIAPKGATSVTSGGINNAGLVALNIDYIPYVYCSKKSTCPASRNAVDIDDKWISAPPTALHAAVCQNGCLRTR